MLMAINVGNDVISIGFFSDSCVLSRNFNISSDIKKTADEYLATISGISKNLDIDTANIDGVIISSVVPQLTQRIKETASVFSECEPLVVGPGVKTGFPIRIDNPSELGGDIVANAAAAIQMKSEGKGVIVADIGAVCTVSAISKNGEYLGCVIFPGVQLSLEALHGNTAQLPNVNMLEPSRAVGKNSQESICSGVLLGNSIMIDGFVEKISSELKYKKESIDLFATGEYASVVLKNCKNEFVFDKHLTLKGLYYIYKNTVKDR